MNSVYGGSEELVMGIFGDLIDTNLSIGMLLIISAKSSRVAFSSGQFVYLHTSHVKSLPTAV